MTIRTDNIHDEPERHIRLARADDAQAVLAIYERAVVDAAVSFEYEPPTVQEMAKRIQGSRDAHAWIVYIYRGQLVGYAYSSRFRGRRAYDWTAEVSVYVHHEHHREGIATNLYKVLHALMAAQGYFTAVAVMTFPNPQSEKFHRALGYQSVGTLPQAGYKNDAWHGIELMSLNLVPESSTPGTISPVLELPSSILAGCFLQAEL